MDPLPRGSLLTHTSGMMAVTCNKCKAQIIPIADVCFVASKGLCLKPELISKAHTFVTVNDVSIQKKSMSLTACWCLNCKERVATKVGGDVPHISFGKGSICYNGTVVEKPSKYFSDREKFPELEYRETLSMHCQQSHTVQRPVHIPSLSDYKDFEWWEGISRSAKIPTELQEEAFVSALLADSLLVIPTGEGKTFAATMVIGAFQRMNPSRMSCFVVKTLPLVAQQSAAILTDTVLIAVQLSSETNTPALFKAIQLYEADVVVCTAGSLIEAFKARRLCPTMFSCFVFDECHHVRKTAESSDYNGVLEHIRARQDDDAEYTPRVVGLSASLVESSKKDANEQIDAVLAAYGRCGQGVQIYQSVPQGAPVGVEEVYLPRESRGAEFDKFFSTRVEEYLKQIRKSVGGYDFGEGDVSNLVNRLHNLLLANYESFQRKRDEKPLYDKLVDFLTLYETSLLLGVDIAVSEASGMGVDDIPPSLSTAGGSPVLDFIVEKYNAAENVIIFVQTKAAARMLQKHLEARLTKDARDAVKVGLVVGKSAPNGMTGDKQQEQISAFRRQSVRAIIATNVLEEGLDVPRCDTVIRLLYTKMSFRQMIQTRGRVRAEGGKFFCVALVPEARGSHDQKKEAEIRAIIATKRTTPTSDLNDVKEYLAEHEQRKVFVACAERRKMDTFEDVYTQNYSVIETRKDGVIVTEVTRSFAAAVRTNIASNNQDYHKELCESLKKLFGKHHAHISGINIDVAESGRIAPYVFFLVVVKGKVTTLPLQPHFDPLDDIVARWSHTIKHEGNQRAVLLRCDPVRPLNVAPDTTFAATSLSLGSLDVLHNGGLCFHNSVTASTVACPVSGLSYPAHDFDVLFVRRVMCTNALLAARGIPKALSQEYMTHFKSRGDAESCAKRWQRAATSFARYKGDPLDFADLPEWQAVMDCGSVAAETYFLVFSEDGLHLACTSVRQVARFVVVPTKCVLHVAPGFTKLYLSVDNFGSDAEQCTSQADFDSRFVAAVQALGTLCVRIEPGARTYQAIAKLLHRSFPTLNIVFAKVQTPKKKLHYSGAKLAQLTHNCEAAFPKNPEHDAHWIANELRNAAAAVETMFPTLHAPTDSSTVFKRMYVQYLLDARLPGLTTHTLRAMWTQHRAFAPFLSAVVAHLHSMHAGLLNPLARQHGVEACNVNNTQLQDARWGALAEGHPVSIQTDITHQDPLCFKLALREQQDNLRVVGVRMFEAFGDVGHILQKNAGLGFVSACFDLGKETADVTRTYRIAYCLFNVLCVDRNTVFLSTAPEQTCKELCLWRPYRSHIHPPSESIFPRFHTTNQRICGHAPPSGAVEATIKTAVEKWCTEYKQPVSAVVGTDIFGVAPADTVMRKFLGSALGNVVVWVDSTLFKHLQALLKGDNASNQTSMLCARSHDVKVIFIKHATLMPVHRMLLQKHEDIPLYTSPLILEDVSSITAMGARSYSCPYFAPFVMDETFLSFVFAKSPKEAPGLLWYELKTLISEGRGSGSDGVMQQYARDQAVAEKVAAMLGGDRAAVPIAQSGRFFAFPNYDEQPQKATIVRMSRATFLLFGKEGTKQVAVLPDPSLQDAATWQQNYIICDLELLDDTPHGDAVYLPTRAIMNKWFKNQESNGKAPPQRVCLIADEHWVGLLDKAKKSDEEVKEFPEYPKKGVADMVCKVLGRGEHLRYASLAAQVGDPISASAWHELQFHQQSLVSSLLRDHPQTTAPLPALLQSFFAYIAHAVHASNCVSFSELLAKLNHFDVHIAGENAQRTRASAPRMAPFVERFSDFQRRYASEVTNHGEVLSAALRGASWGEQCERLLALQYLSQGVVFGSVERCEDVDGSAVDKHALGTSALLYFCERDDSVGNFAWRAAEVAKHFVTNDIVSFTFYGHASLCAGEQNAYSQIFVDTIPEILPDPEALFAVKGAVVVQVDRKGAKHNTLDVTDGSAIYRLSTCRTDVALSRRLAAHFAKTPVDFHVYRVATEVARLVGVVDSCRNYEDMNVSREALVKRNFFGDHELDLVLVEMLGCAVHHDNIAGPLLLNTSLHAFRDVDETALGSALLAFFRKTPAKKPAGAPQDRFADLAQYFSLFADTLQQTRHLEAAFSVIADCSPLNQQEIVIPAPALWFGNPGYFLKLWQQKTGATIALKAKNNARKAKLMLHARGRPSGIRMLIRARQFHKSFLQARYHRAKSSQRSFFPESVFLRLVGEAGDTAMVSFEKTTEALCNSTHDTKLRSIVKGINCQEMPQRADDAHYSALCRSYAEAVVRQVDDHADHAGADSDIQLSVRFGRFYLIDVQRSLSRFRLSVAELSQEMMKHTTKCDIYSQDEHCVVVTEETGREKKPDVHVNDDSDEPRIVDDNSSSDDSASEDTEGTEDPEDLEAESVGSEASVEEVRECKAPREPTEEERQAREAKKLREKKKNDEKKQREEQAIKDRPALDTAEVQATTKKNHISTSFAHANLATEAEMIHVVNSLENLGFKRVNNYGANFKFTVMHVKSDRRVAVRTENDFIPKSVEAQHLIYSSATFLDPTGRDDNSLTAHDVRLSTEQSLVEAHRLPLVPFFERHETEHFVLTEIGKEHFKNLEHILVNEEAMCFKSDAFPGAEAHVSPGSEIFFEQLGEGDHSKVTMYAHTRLSLATFGTTPLTQWQAGNGSKQHAQDWIEQVAKLAVQISTEARLFK